MYEDEFEIVRNENNDRIIKDMDLEDLIEEHRKIVLLRQLLDEIYDN